MKLILHVTRFSRLALATAFASLAMLVHAPLAKSQSWEYFGPDSANWRNVTQIDGQFKPGAPPILGVGTTIGVALFDSGSWRYPALNYFHSTNTSDPYWVEYEALWFSPWEDTVAFLWNRVIYIEGTTLSLSTLKNFNTWSGDLGNASCFSFGSIVFATSTVDSQQVYVQDCSLAASANDGRTWSTLQNPPVYFSVLAADLALPKSVYGLAITGGTPDSLLIFSSSDAGVDWVSVPNPLLNLASAKIVALNGTLTLGVQASSDTSASAGIYFRSSAAAGWTHPLPHLDIGALAANRLHPERIYAVTDAGIYKSTDTGASWAPYNRKLPQAVFYGLVVDPYTDNLYLASDSGVIRVTAGALGVPARLSLPEIFSLRQNYPNPFNPTTTIRYELPRAAFVRLAVYNILGQEVRTLVNQYEQPGFKSVSFNAGALPSGVYFYRITAGFFSDVKKMIYLK